MTTLHEELKELRMLGMMDNRIHHRKISDGRIYTSFQGILLPYNLGVAVILWNLTNSLVYSKMLNTDESKKIILELNPSVEQIHDSSWNAPAMLQHFVAKLGALSLESDSEEMTDDMIKIIS